jgi:general secretion pathway protein E
VGDARLAISTTIQQCVPHKEFLARFSIEFCRRHQFIVARDPATHTPVAWVESIGGGSLIDNVARILGETIQCIVSDRDLIRIATNQFYEQLASQSLTQPLAPSLQEVLVGGGTTVDRADLLESDSRGPVVQLVNQLLLDAIQQGASDVHLQPFEEHVSVRMRLDGVLAETQTLPKSIQEEVVSRLKVAGQMDIAEKRLPQDGRATVSGWRPDD